MCNFIDVIITTSHGRDKNLYYCLKALTLQEFKDFSVIVSDDGSYDNTPDIIKEFKNYFPLTYIWRKNDLKPGRSRNLAVKLSRAQFLIFIDCDILLNNKAILKYSSLFNLNPYISIWGKYGTKDYLEKSEIFSDIRVMKDDERQLWFEFSDIEYETPYFNTWSGNFGISRENFLKVNGFNEQFCGWGCEDEEFGWRLFSNNIKICFNSEVWGEHLPHSNEGKFYNYELIKENRILYHNIINKEDIYEYFDRKKGIFKLKKEPEYLTNYNLGVFYFRLKNYEKAKIFYEKCLKINPFFPQAHYNLGIIYLNEKNFEKAFFHIQMTLRINPNHKKARFILENVIFKFLRFK